MKLSEKTKEMLKDLPTKEAKRKEIRATRERLRYSLRIEKGLCGKCGNPNDNYPKVTCKSCLKKRLADYARLRPIYRKHRIENNLCVRCGHPTDRGLCCANCSTWRTTPKRDYETRRILSGNR